MSKKTLRLKKLHRKFFPTAWKTLVSMPKDGSVFIVFAPKGFPGSRRRFEFLEWSQMHECFILNANIGVVDIVKCGISHWMPIPKTP